MDRQLSQMEGVEETDQRDKELRVQEMSQQRTRSSQGLYQHQSATEAEPAAAAPAGAAEEEEPPEPLLCQGEGLAEQELLQGEDDGSSSSGQKPVGPVKEEEDSQTGPSASKEELSQVEEASELSPGDSNTEAELSSVEEAIKVSPEDSTSDEELSPVEEDTDDSFTTVTWDSELSLWELDIDVFPEDSTSDQELSSVEENIKATSWDSASEEKLSPVEEAMVVVSGDSPADKELSQVEMAIELGAEDSTALPPEEPSSATLELPPELKDLNWQVFAADGLPVAVPREAWVQWPAQEPCSPPSPWPAQLGAQALRGQPAAPRKRPSRFRRALRALRGLFCCSCLRPRPEE